MEAGSNRREPPLQAPIIEHYHTSYWEKLRKQLSCTVWGVRWKGFSADSYLTAILHTPREGTPNYSHLIVTRVNPNFPHTQLTILMLIKMPCHNVNVTL